MIPHLDIEAEYSNTRLSCLIDIEKDNILLMPAFQFFKTKKDMDTSSLEYYSIDNPSYIFHEFKKFLEDFLLNKVSESNKKEHQDILLLITEYKQARELLDMITWLENYGVILDL